MTKETNIRALYDLVREENVHLKRQLAILEEKVSTYEEMYGDNYLPALKLKKIIHSAEQAKETYLKAAQEYQEMTAKYKEDIKQKFNI
ncbi:hypothetical protein [Ileibacterium valens]|uniref:hypothetical protein n=1 Tax=Ileibacterium valens TaxID=1862668 RepID=UPI00272FE435|nr:hypothetical protein [Ileibacterium valens]